MVYFEPSLQSKTKPSYLDVSSGQTTGHTEVYGNVFLFTLTLNNLGIHSFHVLIENQYVKLEKVTRVTGF